MVCCLGLGWMGSLGRLRSMLYIAAAQDAISRLLHCVVSEVNVLKAARNADHGSLLQGSRESATQDGVAASAFIL